MFWPLHQGSHQGKPQGGHLGLFFFFWPRPTRSPVGVGSGGQVKSSRLGFQPATEFPGCEDGAAGSPVFLPTPGKRGGLLVLAEKAWRFLSTSSNTVVYFPGPQRSGPRGTLHHSNDVTHHLGAYQLLLGCRGREGKLARACTGPFWKRPSLPSIRSFPLGLACARTALSLSLSLSVGRCFH